MAAIKPEFWDYDGVEEYALNKGYRIMRLTITSSGMSSDVKKIYFEDAIFFGSELPYQDVYIL